MEGYADPIIGKRRKGDSDSPFVDVSESLQIVSGKVVLSEIPNRFERVQVTIPGQTFYETEKEILNNTEFRVDYFNGVVFFNEMWDGKTPAFKYKGTGAHYFPYSRIWTQKGDALETLQDVMDNTEKGLEVIKTINQIKAENDVAKKNAETQTKYAKDQGDYAKAEGSKATTQANYAKQQGDYAKGEGDAAKSKGETAQQKADFANTQGNFAKQQGDYAKEQGDSAKRFVNDYVKKSGDTLTGSLKMTVPATGSVGYGFQDTSGAETSRFISVANGNVVWQDRTNLIDVLTYSPINKTFTMQAETNLLKKTGDTITGLLTTTDNFRFRASGERNITWRDGNDTEYIKLYANSGGNRLGLWSTKNNKAVWEYHGDNDIFNVTANTNLLKKTGDIMSGSMTMDVKDGQKRFVWAGNNINTGFNASDDPTSQNFSMVDYKNNRTIWTYEPLTNSFNFRGDMIVPWIKKTGDTITGHMAVDVQSGEKVLRSFLGGTNYGAGIAFKTTGMNIYDWSNNSNILDWDSATKTLTLANGVVNTNLMKKTGDTMTGALRHRYDAPSVYEFGTTRKAFQIIHPDDNKLVIVPETAPNSGVWDWNSQLKITDKGTIETAKDGRATLTLTADGDNPDATMTPTAIRRGNTVTITGAMRNIVGSASTVVTVLPADMRPAVNYNATLMATDGTAVALHINANGNVALGTKGKYCLVTATYVVD